MTNARLEGVGPSYSIDKMLDMRVRTRNAVQAIAANVEVGMTEHEARAMARDTLSELGLRRGWHPIIVRLGSNTARQFLDRSGDDVVLGDNDIFFVDIGPIYRGVEGDAGDTFVRGESDEHARAVRDVHDIWDEVRTAWLGEKLTGESLYALATQSAAKRGWQLNLDLSGHRLSDYPHRAHFDGSMAEVGIVPAPDLWVLEIAIVHPDGSFGAFYEDMLLLDQGHDDTSVSEKGQR
jgi:methionyl aminopeptidase